MAKYSNTVEYNIKTSLDSKGLTQLKSELQGLELKLQNMGNKGLLDEKTFSDARNQIQGLGQALTDAFNPSLGMLDLSKLNQELKNNDVTAQGLKTAFSQLGSEGQVAFNNLVGELGKLDTGILRTNSQIDKLFTTFSNTFRWGLVSSFFSNFMNSIHQSVDYVKELDDSLTQIMLVTDYNRDAMNQYAKSANEAAKAVSMTTTGMTNASLVFAQQGYNLNQSQELATLSAKLANASQQDTATTSDQITAYMNAYGLQNSMEELTQQMDNWALIANISAADVSELAQASQRAASMANTVGVSGEQLAAQIATIESVTREAPEQIGNGLKTLYARFSDISQGGEDEEGIKLGDVTQELNKIGVQVLDQFGNIRDIGDIMEDLMVVWDDLDQTSKIAAAQSLAGKYQVNRFVSLMDNSDMYREYKGATGSAATGTLDVMSEEYADSIAGRSAKLQASLEGLFSTIFNTDDIYPWIDAAQGAVDLLQQFFDALGGGKTVLLGISSLLMQVFSKNMAQEINNAATNRAVQQQKLANLQNSEAALTTLGVVNPNPNDINSQNILDFARYMQGNAQNFNAEQMSQANSILEELIQNGNAATMAADQLKKELEQVGTGIVAALGENGFEDFVDQFGAINQSLLTEYLKNNPEEKLADLFSNMVEKIQPAREAILNFNKALQDHQKNLDQYGFESEEAAESASRLRDVLTDLKDRVNGDTIDRYANALSEIENNADNASEETAKLTGETARLVEELDELDRKNIGNIREGLSNTSFRFLNAQSAASDTGKVANAFKTGMDDQANIKNLLDTVNAVQQLTFAWQSFQNLGSIWKNNKLSDGQKFLQTFMSLTSSILMMSPAIDTLSKKFGVLNLQEAANVLTSAKLAMAQSMETIAFGASSVAAGQLTVQQWLLVASSEAATIATTALSAALKLLASPVGIAAIMGIATAIGFIQAQAEEAKQQAQEAFDEAQSKLEQVQSLQESVNNFNEKYNSFKETGEGKQGLVQEAEAIADAMREAGSETQAAAIHLAAIQAEARGTADNFDKLAQEIEKAQFEAEAQANQEVLKTAEETLKIQDTSIEDVMRHQKIIRDAQQELNNLNSWDPGYEEKKEQLERYIQTLKDAKLSQDDLLTTATEGMAAQGRLAGMNALGLNGDNNGMQTKARGWENVKGPADAIRTADAETLRDFFSQNVQGFELLDSMEQLDFMLQNVQDDAQKAAIQVQQLLESNSSLGEHHFGDNVYTDSEEITRALEQTDLTAENSLQLIASLDKDASKAEIKAKIADVQAEMESNGGDFALALKATLDPEELDRAKEQVRDSISLMEPTDSDLDKDSFQETAKYFQEMAEELDDVPDEIALSSESLRDFTEAILRYDNALQDADEHLEDWKKTLRNSSRSISDAAEAFEGIRDLIGDLLDLNTSNLSNSFMESADALDLLDTAIYGTGDEADAAYDQLNALANLDMAGMLDWENGVWSLNDSFNQLSDSALGVSDNAQYAMDSLRGIMEGTISAPEIDATAFVEGLNDMVQSGEMSVDEALAAMDGAQIEADVTTETEDQEDTSQTVGWHPVETEGIDVNASIPVLPVGGTLASGAKVDMQKFSGHVGGWTFEPNEQSETENKSVTVSSVGYKATRNGSGSPTPTFSRGRHKNTSGGVKRNNATGGGGSHSRPSSGGGGGKGSCFVAGTPISMLGYYKNIEKIQVGDIVLSYNEQTKEPEFSQVVQTMIHDVVEPIYTLYIKDEQLRVTGIHRFLITNNIITPNPQWICAEDLHIGDWVLFADGTWHVIHKIEINIEHQVVYNFEVSGNHNYYVGYNQILAHNKGGGGGGSKAKTIEPKEKKTHQKDYYEEVSGQLDKTEKILSKIEKEEDRLIGDKARANQNKQLKLLQKEIDLNKEKQKIQQQELKDIDAEIKEQDRLAESIARTGGVYDSIPDAVFDEDGIVSNYEQISAAIDNIHNKLIDQYNAAAAAGNEDLTKKLSKTIEKFDKYGENILKSAQRHDKLQSEIEGTINELEQLQDTIEDIRIEAWKASTEAIDNIKELRENAADLEGLFSKYESDSPFRDLIIEGEKLNNIWSVGKDQAKDYYNEIIADKQKALKVATDEAEKAAIERSIKYFESLRDTLSDQRLNNGLLGLAYQDMLQLKEWYENPKAEDNPFGDNTAALRDAYEEAYNKVHDMLLEYEKTVEDYRDAIIDGYDEIDEKQNRQIDKFDRIVDKLETFSDMYTLYYGDESYAALRDILQQQGDTLREQLNAQKEIYSYWSEAYAQAIKTGDEKLIQELEDKMHDAEDRMTELAKDAAKAFAESYENAVKASTQYIIQNTIGDRSFNRLDRNWEWDKDYLDKYRDDVEKAYEMDKLRSKYTDLLNQAQGASLQTQNKIRAQMQEQLDLLDGQATVSEYDVKLANAKLEILQKQIALEDAQRNKNQMKLRRDTQGNYRYVYTANQEDVAGAEQDLLDSEYDAYELSKNQQISNYDNLINAYQKYLSQREEILNNANLSEAEKLQQNAELYDKFLKFVNAAKEDFSDAAFGTLDILNWLTLNGTDYTTTAAKDMLNDLLDEQGNIKDQTGIIWMDNANYLTDEVIPKIKNAVNEADQDIKNRMEELKENIVGDDGVFPSIREGGKDLEEGLSGLTGFLDSAKTSTDGLAVATRDLMEALGGDNSALAEAQAQLQKYEKELSNVKNASSITAQQLRDAQKALDKSQTENLNYKTLLDDIASGKRDTKGNLVKKKNTKKTGAAPSKSSKKNGELTGFTGVYHYTSWGDNPVGDWYAGIPNAVRISTFSREPWDGPYNVHLETKEGGHLGWVKEEQLFDTGGYTGNWANGDKRENGKLAFLHQKELVLNAEDTQNILAAVDIVRKIGIGLRNSMMNVSSMNGKNLSSVGETIEQRVEITASFPNATDADDIRQALIGLADKAYQYSHRNR